MKYFTRYAQVKDLVADYANLFSELEILKQLDSGVTSPEEAEAFARFIWKMVDQMRIDTEAGIEVLGSSNNSEMLQDVYYEISDFMAECGYEPIWERVCEDA